MNSIRSVSAVLARSYATTSGGTNNSGWGQLLKSSVETAKGVGDDVQDAMIAATVSRAVKCLEEAVDQCMKEETLHGNVDVSVSVGVGPVSITLTSRCD
jgi:hypothetical protein